MQKIITGSIHVTTNGAFPRKAQDFTGTVNEAMTLMRHYNNTMPILTGMDLLRRAAFGTEVVWGDNRRIGLRIESIVNDRITTQELSDSFSIDMSRYDQRALQYVGVN